MTKKSAPKKEDKKVPAKKAAPKKEETADDDPSGNYLGTSSIIKDSI